MAFSMARPWKDPEFRTLHLRQRTPLDLLSRLKGTKVTLPLGDKLVTVKVGDMVQMSLQTRDPTEAKRLHAIADAALKRFWEAHRNGPISLSQRQIIALSGTVYKELTALRQDEPGPSSTWAHVLRLHQQARAAGKLEQWVGGSVNEVLAREGLQIDTPSRERLIEAVDAAFIQAAQQLHRNAQGDYSPDPAANRFPEWVPPDAAPKAIPEGGSVTTAKLVERWRTYHADKLAKNTLKRYGASFRSLATFMGDRDVRSLTGDDLHAWAEHRRDKENVSARAVNKNDLVAASSMFKWAMGRGGGRVMTSNPAKGAYLDEPVVNEVREKTFRPHELKAILRAALKVEPHPVDLSISNAERWCPWLSAYTGARVAELCNLRGDDIWEEDGVVIMHLRKTKGGVPRKVPLHAHLIEQGFLGFVRSRGAGPLFYDEARHQKGAQADPAEIRAQQLAIWVREAGGLKDRAVAPNHAWRHSFKSTLMGVGIPERISDAITGHKTRGVARRYETPTVSMMAEAIAKFPRYKVE